MSGFRSTVRSCPFCGGSKTRLVSTPRKGWYHVICEGCASEGPASTVPSNSIRAWNAVSHRCVRKRKPKPWLKRDDGALPYAEHEMRP